MNILPYSESVESEWRQFVEAHPDRAMGHLPAIAAIEQVTSAARNRSLIVRDDANRLVGIVPLFEVERRELRAFRTRILCSGTHLPSGPLFAASLSARQQVTLTEQLVQRLLEEARRLHVDALHIAYPTVIRDRPAVESVGVYPLRRFGFRESNVVALVADLRQSEEKLFASLESRARNGIKRCLRGGAATRKLTRDEWLGCYELNRATLGPDAYSMEAIAAIWDLLVAPGTAEAVGTFVEGKLASVVTVTLVGASSYYWFSFNTSPLPLPGTNTLALWEGMLTAQRAGMASFELGSLEFDDPKQVRIGKFKAQFGGRPVYTLAGVRQVRPVRRAALDLIAQAARALRKKKPRPEAESEGPEPDRGASE